jgi:threonine dehydrogenase-like Zn-dependent dehydrogenase
MKALLYRRSIPRYVLLKLLGPRFRRLYSSGVAPLSLVDIAEPKLPTPQWVRIAPRLAGLCGSDLATICAKGSPYLAPVTSMPFVMGHELVGRVTETGAEVRRVRVGDRVVLHPALGCEVRGIEPKCDACVEGRAALCRNVTRGVVSAGIQTGYCRDTGGGFGQSLVAHESQVYRVPDELDDRAAVLIEPFACALHGALRVSLSEKQTALVIGCGSIGLLTIAALRASGCKARITAVARYDHQRRLARELGADELLESPRGVREQFAVWAKSLNAEVLKAELGKPMVIGGADAVFDCVAASQSIDDGIRFTKSGGTFVLVGMPGVPRGVDWTPIWFKELTIRAAYAYGPEQFAGGERDTFDLAIEHMRSWGPRLSPLVGEPFELKDYLSAIDCALNTGRSGVVKTVFAI